MTDLNLPISNTTCLILQGKIHIIQCSPTTLPSQLSFCTCHRTSPTGLTAATLIGKYVTVEPGCMLRSCRVQDFCLVGARSVLLEGEQDAAYSQGLKWLVVVCCVVQSQYDMTPVGCCRG